MNYPNRRLKLVLTRDWHQFNNWLRENEIDNKNERVVYVGRLQDILGLQKENVELIKYGEWYGNEKGLEAIERVYPELLT